MYRMYGVIVRYGDVSVFICIQVKMGYVLFVYVIFYITGKALLLFVQLLDTTGTVRVLSRSSIPSPWC